MQPAGKSNSTDGVVPKFSIAIPVYNRGDYLRQAIVSCLAQTVSDFEVIVSDDCSTEDLQAVAQSFGDPRISYHRAESRLGATANHQTAASLSKGQYIINLHSDDLLLPNCLEIAGGELDCRPEAAAVYFACTYLQGERVSGSSRLPAVTFADQALLDQHSWLHRFLEGPPSCCLFRKTVFDRVGGYNVALRVSYDWDLYLRFLTGGGGVVFLPRILSIYRQHPEQSAQTSSICGLWDMLDLWPQRDDEHWSARIMMGLVLTQCGVKMRSPEGIDGIARMFRELARRGVIVRLLTGLPAAVWDKARVRMGLGLEIHSGDYVSPAMVDEAIEQAKKMVQAQRRLDPLTTTEASRRK